METQPDAGLIKICNENLSLNSLKTFCKNVGVCPQHDALWEEITLREHLYFYASIKKLPEEIIVKTCEK